MSYGLPRGTGIDYGASGFPDWVYQLAQAFGLLASTYPGHQESNRNEAGFAPNPQLQNRGIDWAGPVQNMQRFADYLMTIRGSLEQVIWQNPSTGQRAGVAGGRDVTDTGYYANDYGGHRDHVHTRQSEPIPLPGDVVPPPADVVTYGIDISNHQGVVDLDRVKAEGFSFVWAKVSEGANYRDPFWPKTRDDAKRLGLILAGYHYIRTGDPAAQARLFVDQLGDKTIPAMLDFEAGSGPMSQFWAVKAEIEKLGVRVALSYIPDWYWEQIGKPDLSKVPGLIRSEYVSGTGYASVLYPGNQSPLWGAYGGRTPDILQFTDRAKVAGKSVDANAFRGTPAQLRALLNLETPAQSGEITMSAADELEAQSRGVFPPSDPQKRGGWPQTWRFVWSRFARPFNAIVKDPARGPWGRVQPDGTWQDGHTDSDEQTVTIGEQIAWRNKFSDDIVRDHGDVQLELMEFAIQWRQANGLPTSAFTTAAKQKAELDALKAK